MTVSPDGTTLAAGAVARGGGTVTLWDISNPAHPRQIGQLRTAINRGLAGSVAFGPGGTTLAAGRSGGTVTLWSLPAAALDAGTTGNTEDSVAFGREDTTLAVGTNDSSGGSGTVTAWDLSSPAHPRHLAQFGPPSTAGNGTAAPAVNAVTLSPDGTTLAVGATAGFAGTDPVTLCNLGDPAHRSQCGQPFTVGATASASGPVSVGSPRAAQPSPSVPAARPTRSPCGT